MSDLAPIDLLKIVLPKVSKPGKQKKKNPNYPEATRIGHRERILRTKPWLKTKGAITPEGKRRCSQNSLKHGHYTKAMREVRKIEQQIKKELGKDEA